MPDKYEKDMTVLMKAAAEVKVSSKKLKRYVITQRKVSEYALIAVSVLWGQFPKYKSPGGLYLEGWFNGGFFALPDWRAYILRGLYMEGLIFGILRY